MALDMAMIDAMRSLDEQKGPTLGASDRELRLLSEVHRSPLATQRDLSRRVGIALGLTNMLLRNMVEKGYVRIAKAGWRRSLYSLTPTGMSRKIHLTLAYVQRVVGEYRQVRQTLREELELVALHEESRVAIYGTEEFSELVYLALREMGIEEIDIFAAQGQEPRKFLGLAVRGVKHMIPNLYDCVIVASLGDLELSYSTLADLGVSHEKMVTFFADGSAMEVVG